MKEIMIKITLVLLIVIPSLTFSNENDCNRFLEENFPSYLEINDKEFNSNGYMYFVQGEDGRCEYGIGISDKDAFNECEHWKNENGIIGNCNLYAKGEEIVWINSNPTPEETNLETSKNEKIKNSFEIINLTKIEDRIFLDMKEFATSRMDNMNVSTIAIIYPIGRFISPEMPQGNTTSYMGATHKVVIKENQIKKIELNLKNFLSKTSCINNDQKNIIINDIKQWLKIGGASQSQDPICKNIRIILISVDPDRKKNKDELMSVFFHEAYHSFQQDLTNGCSGPNDLWVIEAGAEYFAQYLLSHFKNIPEKYVSNILKIALRTAKREGNKFKDPGVAEKGLGGLRLMVERGWLDESRIINGSLFHDCARVKEFKNDDPKILFIKNHWHEIIKRKGVYVFKESALN